MNTSEFLHALRIGSKYLSKQERLTLKGQAIHGDVAGAEKGLQNLMRKKRKQKADRQEKKGAMKNGIKRRSNQI